MKLRFTPISRPSAKREARIRTLLDSAVTANAEGEISLGYFDQLTPLLELSEFEPTEIAAILGGLMLLLERSEQNGALRRVLDEMGESTERHDLLLAIGNKSCLLRDPLATASMVHASAAFSVLSRSEIAKMQTQAETFSGQPQDAGDTILFARVRPFSSDGDSIRWLSVVLSQASQYGSIRLFTNWLEANEELKEVGGSVDSLYQRHTSTDHSDRFIDEALVFLVAEARAAQTGLEVMTILSKQESKETLEIESRERCLEKLKKLLSADSFEALGLEVSNVFEKANALSARLSATIRDAAASED